MAYALIFFDNDNTAELRLRLRQAHIDYMKQNLARVIASGGLLTDDGTTGQGGLIILDTDDRSEVEAFVANDPFFTGGLYTSYKISRWRKAFLDFKSYLP